MLHGGHVFLKIIKSDAYQLVEVDVVDPHDLSLIAQLRLLFVLTEFHCGQTGTWQGELNGVAPHFPLMWNRGFGIML